MTARHNLTRNARHVVGLALRHLIEEAAAFVLIYLVLVVLASIVLVAGWAVMHLWPGIWGEPPPLYPAWIMLCLGHLAVLATGLVVYCIAILAPRWHAVRPPSPAPSPAPPQETVSGPPARTPDPLLPPLPPAPEDKDAWL